MTHYHYQGPALGEQIIQDDDSFIDISLKNGFCYIKSKLVYEREDDTLGIKVRQHEESILFFHVSDVKIASIIKDEDTGHYVLCLEIFGTRDVSMTFRTEKEADEMLAEYVRQKYSIDV